MKMPKHPLSASGLIQAALANAAIPATVVTARRSREDNMVSRARLERSEDAGHAVRALMAALSHEVDVEQMDAYTIEVIWP